ncbi:mannitol dehydrogenase family protein [Ningiella sp. W23]|uniref:mannitol dehydrogenase family protein n=1 Tax=Ningiella sp. W23 TaxID=3023715 RepID=UPI003757975F
MNERLSLSYLEHGLLEHDSERKLRPNLSVITRPARSENTQYIVHLGIGAFHRAHQAVYTQRANELAGSDWRIIGVSMRSAAVFDQLAPQDGLYTVIEQSPEHKNGKHSHIISVIDEVLVAPDSPSAVVNKIASPQTQIVSLTITEKGYCLDPASGHLDLSHADIKHDLANVSAPKSAIGLIVSALKQRIENKRKPLTIISCDNLPENGLRLKGSIIRFAEQLDEALAQTIENHYCFPCTMVDRIVPATTKALINKLSEELGYRDYGLVTTEAFSQWVIEDNFAQGRPAWDSAGAIFAKTQADVQAFETMKLRLLNGAHSSIAYLGYLAGKTFVADVMKVPALSNFIRYIMQEELLPTVKVPDGIDAQHYCHELLTRFSNEHLHHRCYQIAMDGSQKLPQRLLAPLHWRLINEQEVRGICLVIAAWMQYVSGIGFDGQEITVQDPFADDLAALAKAHRHHREDTQSYIERMINFEAVFGSEFKQDPAFYSQLLATLLDCYERFTSSPNIESALTDFLSEVKH